MKSIQKPQYEPMEEEDYLLYKFLIDYIKVNGYPPTVREIAQGIFCGISAVQSKLMRLQVLGKIEFKSGVARAIRLLEYEFVRKASGK